MPDLSLHPPRRAVFLEFPPRENSSNGFTLLEVLVAVAILGFALMAVIHLRNESIRDLRRMVDYSDAWVLGARKMGEIETAEVLDEGGEGGMFEDNPVYRWDASKTKYEVDIASQYFPNQEGRHKPRELLRIELTISLVEPVPGRPPEVFRLVSFTKKRKPGMAPQ